MTTYAVIPARSGSKGLPNKNIQKLAGHPLIAYSISFAKSLGVDRVICSTDSLHYAEIARSYGAEVPFLRSPFAATDTAMEHDILRDLADQFEVHKIANPHLIVWLRPTFVFRDIPAVRQCIQALEQNPKWTSARTVCETEARLYSLNADRQLLPKFDDGGRSMIRRQEIGSHYKVYSTDVIRFNRESATEDFLGRHVFGTPINKMCGLDIDDIEDFRLIEAIITGAPELVEPYIHLELE